MQVKVLNDCFLADGTYRKKNEQFEYTGPKNENLQPLKKAPADLEQAGTVLDKGE